MGGEATQPAEQMSRGEPARMGFSANWTSSTFRFVSRIIRQCFVRLRGRNSILARLAEFLEPIADENVYEKKTFLSGRFAAK